MAEQLTPEQLIQYLQAKITEQKPQPQPMFGLNNPNSVVGQLGDIGNTAMRQVGIEPFGPQNPDQYQTVDTQNFPGTHPKYETRQQRIAAIPFEFGAGLTKVVAEPKMGLGGAMGGGYFLDGSGQFHELLKAGHESTLLKSGLMNTVETSTMPKSLAQHKLIRIRDIPGSLAVEMGGATTHEAMEVLRTKLLNTDKQVNLDLYKVEGGKLVGGVNEKVNDGAKAWDLIQQFYGNETSAGTSNTAQEMVRASQPQTTSRQSVFDMLRSRLDDRFARNNNMSSSQASGMFGGEGKAMGMTSQGSGGGGVPDEPILPVERKKLIGPARVKTRH